jgi:hypothetical protein
VLLAIAQTPMPVTGQAPGDSKTDSQKPNYSGKSGKNPPQTTPRVVTENPTHNSDEAHPQSSSSDSDNRAINVTNPTPAPVPWGVREWVTWWADLLLAIVGVGTLIVVCVQAQRMKEHAEEFKKIAAAAFLNAQAVINAERAWMVANAENLHIPHSQWSNEIVGFDIRCVNKGKTPAFLLEMGNHGITHPRGTLLPAVQPPYEPQYVEKWDGDGLPLQPGADMVRHLIIITSCPEKIHIGQDDLWIYGYIKYRDAFGVDRETRYCFLWDNNCSKFIEEDRPSCYMPRGPASYNRAT